MYSCPHILNCQVDPRQHQRTTDRDEVVRRLATFDGEETTGTISDFDEDGSGRFGATTSSGHQHRLAGHRAAMTSRRSGGSSSSAAAAAAGICTASGGSMSSLQLCYVNLQYTSVGKDLDAIATNGDVAVVTHEVCVHDILIIYRLVRVA